MLPLSTWVLQWRQTIEGFTMSFFSKILAMFDTSGQGEIAAGSQLPPIPQPKVPARPMAIPSHLKSAKPSATKLQEKDLKLASSKITDLRTRTSTKEVTKDLTAAFPDLSASVDAYLRTAITSSYTVVAKNLDGTFNYEATDAANQILARFDTLKNYATGFNGMYSIRSISESLAKELRLYGSCSMELVLGKGRLPDRLSPVSVTKIKFYQDGLDFKPVQVIGGEEIDLDFPTFFYVSLDQDLTEPYSASPMESAVQPVLFGQEFFDDVRRVIRRAIHPKMVVTLDEDTVRRSIPAEYYGQPEQIKTYIDGVISGLTQQINGLNPEDALVVLSSIEAAYMNNGNQSLDAEYNALTGLIDAKVAPGTASYLDTPAMTPAQRAEALAHGVRIVRALAAEGCNVVGFGEMGIGNTASASLLTHCLTGLPLAECVGRGTGLDDAGLARKQDLLEQALLRYRNAGGDNEPFAVLAEFGGFEIATMVGAMLAAAEAKMVLLIDGFIVGSAALVASRLAPEFLDYCVFCHRSAEAGHRTQLLAMGAEPLLDLGLRLGEGTGAALAYPLVTAAVNFLNEMASFESAGVSDKE